MSKRNRQETAIRSAKKRASMDGPPTLAPLLRATDGMIKIRRRESHDHTTKLSDSDDVIGENKVKNWLSNQNTISASDSSELLTGNNTQFGSKSADAVNHIRGNIERLSGSSCKSSSSSASSTSPKKSTPESSRSSAVSSLNGSLLIPSPLPRPVPNVPKPAQKPAQRRAPTALRKRGRPPGRTIENAQASLANQIETLIEKLLASHETFVSVVKRGLDELIKINSEIAKLERLTQRT